MSCPSDDMATFEDTAFQHLVNKTITLFDTEYANKGVHSEVTRNLLVNKWLKRDRIQISKLESSIGTFISVDVIITDRSKTCGTLDDYMYKIIIGYAEDEALKTILKALEQADNKHIRLRISRLKMLAKTLKPKYNDYSRAYKYIIVKYATKPGHMKPQDYEDFVQEIKQVNRENYLSGMFELGLTKMIFS